MYLVLDIFVRNQNRNWREIGDELLREPNTAEMGRLMKELNEASVELEEAEMKFGWHRVSDRGKLLEPPEAAGDAD